MGVLQVHGIGSRRLVYKEVAEVQSNYKKSYFWWFWNPPSGDSDGTNQTEKDKVAYLLDLSEEMRKTGHYKCVWCLIHVILMGVEFKNRKYVALL